MEICCQNFHNDLSIILQNFRIFEKKSSNIKFCKHFMNFLPKLSKIILNILCFVNISWKCCQNFHKDLPIILLNFRLNYFENSSTFLQIFIVTSLPVGSDTMQQLTRRLLVCTCCVLPHTWRGHHPAINLEPMFPTYYSTVHLALLRGTMK